MKKTQDPFETIKLQKKVEKIVKTHKYMSYEKLLVFIYAEGIAEGLEFALKASKNDK